MSNKQSNAFTVLIISFKRSQINDILSWAYQAKIIEIIDCKSMKKL